MKVSEERSAGVRGGALSVVTVKGKKDVARFHRLLAEEHGLGNRPPAGNTLRQAVAREDGEWVALLLWGGASPRLKARDTFIGWDAAKRSSRLKLVVQNSRFLVIGATREPNLASQALAAALRALPEQWREAYGYSPVLAETFTDSEIHRGTCYRASGWTEAGDTAGYSRDTTDFYVPNGRPKRLWLKPLDPDWKDALRRTVPRPCDSAALTDPPGRELPVAPKLAESLIDALAGVPDHRAGNRHHAIGPMLATLVLAVMCGRTSLNAMHRFAQGLTPDQKRLLCFRRNKKHAALRKTPSYKAYWMLLRDIDHGALAECLGAWFRSHLGALPPALAMDGKMVRDLAGTLNISDAATGRTAACVPIKKNGKEIPVAREALAGIPGGLGGATVTGDAAHCQKQTARQIVDAEGEYLLQAKANQRALLAKARALEGRAPFLTST
jgi:hypothetical protein